MRPAATALLAVVALLGLLASLSQFAAAETSEEEAFEVFHDLGCTSCHNNAVAPDWNGVLEMLRKVQSEYGGDIDAFARDVNYFGRKGAFNSWQELMAVMAQNVGKNLEDPDIQKLNEFFLAYALGAPGEGEEAATATGTATASQPARAGAATATVTATTSVGEAATAPRVETGAGSAASEEPSPLTVVAPGKTVEEIRIVTGGGALAEALASLLGGGVAYAALALAALGLAGLAVVAAGRLQAGGPGERGPGSPGPSAGLDELEALLGRPIPGLGRLEACRGEGFTARLPPVAAPAGYEGEWRCCRLGCGGWGCAYRCERPSGGGPVVFKVPRGLEALVEEGIAPTLDPRLVERVAKEAEAVASLRHPHLLRLLAYSRAAPLLVYEYADGGSLEAWLARGWRPSPREALLIAVQLGDALRYVHSRGMVHGDVKPGNVLVRGGVVKLGDFSGLVRLVTVTSRHTPAYTPGWRAPEQVYLDLRRRAVERGLENRIDVYQLGNLLLYLLTGEALDGEEAASPGRLEQALARVDHEALRGVLREMLAVEPWRRPSMDEAVKKLLEAYRGLSGR